MSNAPNGQLERYTNAVESMNNAKTWRDFHFCQLQFMDLGNFMDSKELAKKCIDEKQRLEFISKENTYNEAKEKISTAKSVTEHQEIIQLLGQISGYKDTDELLKKESEIASELLKEETKRSTTFIEKITNITWNSNPFMIILALLILVPTFFIFSGTLLLFIAVTVILGIGFVLYFYFSSDIIPDQHIGKVLFIVIFLAIAFGLLLGLICGIDLYPNTDGTTCGICGGSGKVTSKFLGEGSGVQKGFDTYYRCKGCHGSGRD